MLSSICSVCGRRFAERYKKLTALPNLIKRGNHQITWNAAIEKHVDDLMFRYSKLNTMLLDSQDITPTELKDYSTELRQIQPVAAAVEKLYMKREEMLELAAMIVMDEEFKSAAAEETLQYQKDVRALELKVINLIVPKDKDDSHDAILEIRAASGGREAAIFAMEMFTMYSKFCTWKNWKFDLLSKSENSEGGLKDASASVIGKDVFSFLKVMFPADKTKSEICSKHEIGVHRVQRVPTTETLGRVHTSTITVAVLPQPEDIDIIVDAKDIRLDTFKSSGAGGQHVNTTDSAVRLTHIPTGIIVSMQEERSQIKNRSKAMRVLKAKLYDFEKNRAQKERHDSRKMQVGTGHRSERIRTYNCSQDRITDHRIGENIHGFEELLTGGYFFHDLLIKLQNHEKLQSLGSITDMKPSIRI